MEALAEMEFWGHAGVFTANDVRRMYDVEFISEIAIAYLHGVQNKKHTLDRWYAAYEVEFDRSEEVSEVFRRVLGELEQVLPDLARTRWSQKSDFYSLYLHLAFAQRSLPLNRTARTKLAKDLNKVGTQIDNFVAGEMTRASAAVRQYANAVQKAASDLSNRKARASALRKLLPLTR